MDVIVEKEIDYGTRITVNDEEEIKQSTLLYIALHNNLNNLFFRKINAAITHPQDI
jgi:hypothetical protein